LEPVSVGFAFVAEGVMLGGDDQGWRQAGEVVGEEGRYPEVTGISPVVLLVVPGQVFAWHQALRGRHVDGGKGEREVHDGLKEDLAAYLNLLI